MASHIKAQEQVEIGDALYREGDYAEACKAYQQAVQVEPDYIEAYNNWGLALAAQGKYAEAIEQYQQAIKLNPDYVEAYNNWGNTLGEQNRYEEAIERYQQATRMDKDYAYAYHNIAHYLWRQGKYQAGREAWEEACRAYKRAKQKAKDSNNTDHFYYYGGVLHDIFGTLNEAEEIYKEGLTLDPNHIGILTGLGNLYLEQKDEDVYENVHGRAETYWKARENYRKAKHLLEYQLQKEEDAFTLLQLGELLLKMEEYTEAKKYLVRALEKDQESSAPYADLGVLYTRKEDFKRGAQYFEDALRRDPDDLTVWSNLTETYLNLKLKEKAEAECKKILRITPKHVESQIGLGEVYTAVGDEGNEDMYEQAIHHFTNGINLIESQTGSKRLRKKELAAAYYSRGYARVKLYEASKVVGDERLLHEALKDFKKCFDLDPDRHKAGQAVEKLKKRLRRFSPQWFIEKIGPLLILVPSSIILALGQSSFFFGRPNNSINIGSYMILTFGSLVFMVIGLYLPQILKLKVAGIELEKSSVNQITTSGTLGISK